MREIPQNIKPEILDRIRLNRELMAKLGKSTKTHGRSAILITNRFLRENKPDGPLTKLTRLQMISKALDTPIKKLIQNVQPQIDSSREVECGIAGTG